MNLIKIIQRPKIVFTIIFAAVFLYILYTSWMGALALEEEKKLVLNLEQDIEEAQRDKKDREDSWSQELHDIRDRFGDLEAEKMWAHSEIEKIKEEMEKMKLEMKNQAAHIETLSKALEKQLEREVAAEEPKVEEQNFNENQVLPQIVGEPVGILEKNYQEEVG